MNTILEAPPATPDAQKPLGPNGVTEERLADFIASIERNNRNPEYRAALEEASKASDEYRREVNAQERRWLDEEEGKKPAPPGFVNPVSPLTPERRTAILALGGTGKNDPLADAWMKEIARYREQIQREEEAARDESK